jgi:predicted DCC family thiol-disulfide oxidoreductase YuxK
VIGIAIFLVLMPALLQDQSYHAFADRRALSAFPISGCCLEPAAYHRGIGAIVT